MDTYGFSFGAIFLGDQVNNSQTLKHEYGHRVHLDQIGILAYAVNVVIPSVTASQIIDVEYDDYYSLPFEYIADMLGGVNRDNGEYVYHDWAAGYSEAYWWFTYFSSYLSAFGGGI